MSIHGYPGGVISATPPTVSPSSATGVWTLEQQFQNAANWPSQSNIARSLRFNSADSAYLNRTPASAGNRKTWTLSCWVKRSNIGVFSPIFTAATIAPRSNINFRSDDALEFRQLTSSETDSTKLITTQVFRDVGAWYHLVFVQDTTQATSSNRAKMYVNGVQVTAFSTATYPSQDFETLAINNNVVHELGRYASSTGDGSFPGYMADVYFIDGQALTPSSFGYTDSNGIWQPNSYTGSYGTNGFWLNFDDNSGTTATTLGKDSSGNGNNWTPNNFSVTAGVGNDSLVDSPTNYGTDTGVGGEVRGNYATLNPLYGTGITANFYTTNGNLDLNVDTNSGYRNLAATFSPENFKGYFEVYCSTSPNFLIGFAFESISPSNVQYQNAGTLYINNAGDVKDGLTTIKSSCTPSFSSTDVLQVAFDFTNGARNVWFGRNGTWGSNASGVGVPSTGTNPVLTITSASRFHFGINSGAGTVTIAANFGQRPFAYTAPAGFKALCSTNLPTPTIQKGASYFNTVLRNGFGTSGGTVTTGFYPDLVWQKQRNGISDHYLANTITGGTKLLRTNSTAAEITDNNWITAFSSTGFTQGSSDFGTGDTVAIWAWNANSGSSSSNTAGSITSTVSANQTAGFSVVTYTGNGTNGATIGHGLGSTPNMLIVKSRSGSDSWIVYHTSLGNTQFAVLNNTDAAQTASTLWNNTSPTSTVFTVGTSGGVNTNTGTYVAYCFALVSGYSAFGAYVGNGSADGPFVYTGFRPAYVLIKRSSSSGTNWQVLDTQRSPYNLMASALYASASVAEFYDATVGIDSLSNGFKIRGADGNVNSNGATYIYAAFAENPFKIARAR